MRRDTVADTLTHAATSGRAPALLAVLAAAATDVANRIVALRAPAPRLVLWRVALLLGLLAATAIAVAVAMHDTERLFRAGTVGLPQQPSLAARRRHEQLLS